VESAKLNPSENDLLWVVAYYSRRVTHRKVREKVAVLPRDHAQFLDEHGKFSPQKYVAYIAHKEREREEKEPDLADPSSLSSWQIAACRFLRSRIDEIRIAEAFHAWPDNLAPNPFAAWRWQIWWAYLAGAADERHRQDLLR